MSFAVNAAPFSENDFNNDSVLDKRRARNRTIKKQPRSGEETPDVLAMIERLHNASPSSDDNDLSNFKPIPKPVSVGVEKTMEKDDPVQVEAYTNKQEMSSSNAEYYQQFVPNFYNKMSEQPLNTNGELLQKLNYMIQLLEEQQDEKTGHVTEEVILYSFLGVFMIFIVDSFARVGKYVR
jgi:hypothetical protein